MNPILTKGFTGVLASATGVGLSFLPHIETALRIASLLLGIAIGIVTLVSILRHKK